ncbi:MAG: histidine kinase, partial [Planctomycetota bacterium]|nr:histidine kinase [Planctomycetota bacterium]
DGVVISHTDRQRIMASFKNKSLQEARQGKEGTEETTDLRGVPVLMSVKRLHAAPWLLAANYPTAELYAPIVRARRFSYVIAGIGALTTVVLIWLLVGYLTRALYHLTAQVAGIGRAPESGSRVGVEAKDEVGRLADAINSMLEALGRSQQQLQSLASELAITEERERRRIATDLHDSICQTLALANMKLGQIQTAAPDAAMALETARRHIEKAVADMRSLIFDLSPPIVYELGLAPALEWLAEQCAKEYGLEVEVHDDGAPKPLASEVRIFLFRACRELLLNVVKHAGVRRAQVTLARSANAVQLRVEDRGKGFDTRRLEIGRDRREGFGLFSIRERLSYFGGAFQIRSQPGGGTEVSLVAPLAPPASVPTVTEKEE